MYKSTSKDLEKYKREDPINKILFHLQLREINWKLPLDKSTIGEPTVQIFLILIFHCTFFKA